LSSQPFTEIPHCGQLIASLLPPSPHFCDRDFAAVLAEFYHRCAGYTGWEPAKADEETLARIEHDFSRSRWKVLCPSLIPGVEPVLQAEDINGVKKRHSLYETSV